MKMIGIEKSDKYFSFAKKAEFVKAPLHWREGYSLHFEGKWWVGNTRIFSTLRGESLKSKKNWINIQYASELILLRGNKA